MRANGKHRFRLVVVSCGASLLTPIHLCAQQTIFNVLTTDVLDRGKVYVELDVSFKTMDSTAVKRFSSFVPRVVVGAGGRIEVGLNIAGNMQPGQDTTTLVPTIKWKLYQGEKNAVAVVVGGHLFLPVRNRGYNAGTYTYAEVSRTLRSGTRLTAGGYNLRAMWSPRRIGQADSLALSSHLARR